MPEQPQNQSLTTSPTRVDMQTDQSNMVDISADIAEDQADVPDGDLDQTSVSELAVEDEAAEEAYEDPADFLAWEASEYVHHHKGAMWYGVLAVVVVIMLIVAVVFQSWLSIGVFVIMGVAIAVYAHKPPRVLAYQLDTTGITIDGKIYPYDNFRSFGVLRDIEWHTIDLEPARRLMPRLTVLFGDDDLDDIVAHLERHLPRADRDPDLVERLTRYLRF